MLRLASDENFNGASLRRLLRREASLDVLRAQDAGLLGADDPTVLAWAAREARIPLTHDRATMPDFAYDRVRAGQPMPGVVVGMQIPIGQAIDDLHLLALCSDPEDLEDAVLHLPL